MQIGKAQTEAGLFYLDINNLFQTKLNQEDYNKCAKCIKKFCKLSTFYNPSGVYHFNTRYANDLQGNLLGMELWIRYVDSSLEFKIIIDLGTKPSIKQFQF